MKLLILQGLPGSGKSTLAQQMVAADPTWVIVNKDSIRRELELTGWTWSKKNEKEVIGIRDHRIMLALGRGNNVISDDTNFGYKHVNRISEIGKKFGAEVELYVMQTPLEECIRRDAQRTGKAHVGEAVIRRMWSEYLAPHVGSYQFAPYQRDPKLDACVICDLDGTLALFMHKRGPYEAEKCADDDVNWPVAEAVWALVKNGYRLFFVSGRDAKYRPQTEAFLEKTGLQDSYSGLFMRPTGDTRKDWIIKGELFDKHIRGKYNVLCIFDDRNQVVNFWRSIGLTVFQVADGDF